MLIFTDRKPRLKVVNTLAKVTETIHVTHCLHALLPRKKLGNTFKWLTHS